MRKEKYVYNPSTLKFEKLRLSTKQVALRLLGYASATCFSAIVLFLLASHYMPSPKEKSLTREIEQLQYYYATLNNDIEKVAQDVEFLHEKDTDIHRIIFGLESIDESVWNGGVGGSERYPYLNNFRETGELIKTSLSKVDKLKRKVELQMKSVDTIFALAVEREEKLMSIPSIKPVQEDQLKRNINYLSGYGWRIHPVHKVKKFHKGIDFTAPRGTAIQATGNGTIKKISKQKSGYGTSILIDHGFGYTTLYAHLDVVFVKEGEKVTRGQKIGNVGSTGTSTAPHLHYEVHKNGKAINPIDYCMDGLSTAEYQELVERSSIENQSFD